MWKRARKGHHSRPLLLLLCAGPLLSACFPPSSRDSDCERRRQASSSSSFLPLLFLVWSDLNFFSPSHVLDYSSPSSSFPFFSSLSPNRFITRECALVLPEFVSRVTHVLFASIHPSTARQFTHPLTFLKAFWIFFSFFYFCSIPSLFYIYLPALCETLVAM